MSDTVPWQLEMPRHESMAGRVHRHLKEAIVSGNLAPGQRLLETEIARQLSVSRSRVREALAKLEQEGLIFVSAFRGTWVSELTPRDIEEIYEARLLIEPAAARIVAMRRDPEILATLRQDITRMRTALASADVFEMTDADHDFHIHLVVSTGNRRIADMARRLLDFIWRLTPAVYANPSMPQMLVAEHTRAVDAIASGNGRIAEKTLREHLKAARASTLRELLAASSGKPVAEVRVINRRSS
jgi:DNA-binding GntR family transcriptional regulator